MDTKNEEELPVAFVWHEMMGVVYITDMNRNGEGVTSVKAAIDFVLEQVLHDIGHFPGNRALYRDGERLYDGILLNEDGTFKEFIPLREDCLQEAIIKLNTKLQFY